MSDLRYWIGFSLISGIGAARIRRLLEQFGSLQDAWGASISGLRGAGLSRNLAEQVVYQRDRLDLDADLARLDQVGVQALTWDSPDYPSLLREVYNPPPVLYVRGEIAPADSLSVALVGTRSPSVNGKETARRLGHDLAENGITVVSGLALGIDGIAHRAALDAGGRTLAVLACGLDQVYPARHRELASRIIAQGALISDYALGVKPEARNFPPRNRIISGLSLGTVVVEAGIKSGALITLRFAIDQGRETFAVPGNIQSRASMGTNQAIQRGHAKLVTCVQDILQELNISMIQEQRDARQVLPETADERALWEHLSDEPIHIDELVRVSGLPTEKVSATLTLMELKGLTRSVERMSYVRNHS